MKRILVGLLSLFASGCGADLAQARLASDATTRTVNAAAPLLHDYCTAVAQGALAEVRAMPPGTAREDRARDATRALERHGCPRFANAYEGAYTSALTLDAVVTTAEAGQCIGVSRSSEDCNTAGALARATIALAALATACPKNEQRCDGLRAMAAAVKAAVKASHQ